MCPFSKIAKSAISLHPTASTRDLECCFAAALNLAQSVVRIKVCNYAALHAQASTQ